MNNHRKDVVAVTSVPPVVLVVHPDHLFYEQILPVLKANGYDSLPALNGAHARLIIDFALPDLIVTATEMPEEDGPEMIRRLRANIGTTTVPIIRMGRVSDRALTDDVWFKGKYEFFVTSGDQSEDIEGIMIAIKSMRPI